MLFFVIGLPGRFAEWCESAATRLVQHEFGSAALIAADTFEEVTHTLLHSGGTAHGVVAARHPGGRIRRALAGSGRPFVVVRDDPWAALADLVAGRGLGLVAATRLVASSCASLGSFAAMPGALVLDARRDDPLTAADRIAAHLGLCSGGGELTAPGPGGDSGLGAASGAGAADPAVSAAWRDALAPDERALAEGALGPGLDDLAGNLGPIAWSPELFFVGDRPEPPATGGVDITGRARCLLRGPQIMLPPAIWSAAVTVEISPDAAEHGFVVEANAGGARAVIHPGRGGVFETSLTLALGDLPDRPIELLLSTQRPAFHGHLTLLRVALTPQPHPPATAAEPATVEAPPSAP
jgi:hypothetical protein